MVWFWLTKLAFAGATVTLPATDTEVEFATSAQGEVEAAMSALSAAKFDEAARAFAALADASGSADLRYLEAVSRYEAGDLAQAERAAADGLKRDAKHAPLLALYGLILGDLGRGDEALTTLDRAKTAATDPLVQARVVLNRGVIRLDRGEVALAIADFTEAKTAAGKLGAADLVATADEDLALAAAVSGDGAGSDALGVVGSKLRKGDIAGAKAAIPSAPTDRRGKVRVLLASGSVLRAEGRLDDAAATLTKALAAAREGGLIRESAAALAALGVVYGAAGRYELANDRLQEAVSLVAGTSFRANEVGYRVEAGRVAVRLEDLEGARGQLAVARRVAAGVEDPLGTARLAELEGLIADQANDVTAATTAFTKSIDTYERRGEWAEAARVGTELVTSAAGRDEAALKTAITRTEGLFSKSGDVLGPAHAAVAEGLGRSRRGDLDGALTAFSRASTAAEAVGTARGRSVAAIAREDGAQTLKALGHSEDAVAKAQKYGLGDAVKSHEGFAAAQQDYETARAAFDAKKYSTAKTAFERSWKGFEAIGETAYAAQARRGRAWSEFNATVGQPAASAAPVWAKLVEEATVLGEAELRIRAMGAGALDAAELKSPGALASVRAAGDAAEKYGLTPLAGQLYAKRAELETSLDDRLAAARRAWSLRTDKVGVYAMYSVAVDLYNAERYAEARAIAEEVFPVAGDLGDAVRDVRDASASAGG